MVYTFATKSNMDQRQQLIVKYGSGLFRLRS